MGQGDNTPATDELCRHLLGWQFQNRDAILAIREAAFEFSDVPHQALQGLIFELDATGKPVTCAQVAAEAVARVPAFNQEVIFDFLRVCIDEAPTVTTPEMARRYVQGAIEAVRRAEKKAHLNERATAALESIAAGEGDPVEAIKGLTADIAGLDLECASDSLCAFTASEFASRDVPQREELVEALIPHKAVTLLAGDGGTGKSLLALQLAVAVQLGSGWIGRGVQRRGPVIYLSAEDDRDELHRRLSAIVAAEGANFDDLKSLHLAPLVGQDAVLATETSRYAIGPTALFRALESRCQRTRPELVVLDTLSDLFGGDENNRVHARQFVGLLRGLAIRQDCSVLLLAHPSLSGLNSGSGTSGSTGWNNSVRSRLYLERCGSDEDDQDTRILKAKKANYGPVGTEIRIRWDRGVFRTENGNSGVALAREAKAERVFLAMLDAYQAEGRNVNASGGRTYAPTVFAADKARSEGVSQRAFTDAMNRLFEAGRIRSEEHGPQSKRRSRIVIVGG